MNETITLIIKTGEHADVLARIVDKCFTEDPYEDARKDLEAQIDTQLAALGYERIKK